MSKPIVVVNFNGLYLTPLVLLDKGDELIRLSEYEDAVATLTEALVNARNVMADGENPKWPLIFAIDEILDAYTGDKI